MNKSKKKQKSNVNKGYPRRVVEKYWPTPEQKHARPPTLDMTAPHNERKPGSTVSQEQNTDKEVAIGTEGVLAGRALPEPSAAERQAAEPQAAEQQILLTSSVATQPDEGNTSSPGGEEAEADPRRGGGRSDKRTEPQNLAEFIDAFLTGKVKSLSEPVARRLKSSSPQLEPAVRGDLLRRAQAVDNTLDKVRKLMLVATQLSTHKLLAHLVMDFCADCILANPFIRTGSMRPMLFPGNDDTAALEDAWAQLQTLAVPTDAHTNMVVPEGGSADSHGRPGSDEASVIASGKETAKDGTVKAAPPRAIAALALRSQRNALWCAAIWRVQRGQIAFAEMIRTVRATLFSLKKRPESLEDELLEALANVPDKEAEPLALLWEWNVRQQTETMNRLTDTNRRAAALNDEVCELKERLGLALAQADTLKTQLADERTAREASETALGVAKTHGQADLEGVRALALNTLRDAVSQLDVVSEALKREPPKVLSALDKVDAVMDRLKATNNKLENT